MSKPADGHSRKIKLSLEEWCQLAKEGIAVPITTPLRWISMEPMIRVNRDPVTFIPVSRDLIPGDVVLFKRQDGAYVCHRVYKILDKGIDLKDKLESIRAAGEKYRTFGGVSDGMTSNVKYIIKTEGITAE